jgi:hypothetical protein
MTFQSRDAAMILPSCSKAQILKPGADGVIVAEIGRTHGTCPSKEEKLTSSRLF